MTRLDMMACCMIIIIDIRSIQFSTTTSMMMMMMMMIRSIRIIIIIVIILTNIHDLFVGSPRITTSFVIVVALGDRHRWLGAAVDVSYVATFNKTQKIVILTDLLIFYA
jgi:hypothetical protein